MDRTALHWAAEVGLSEAVAPLLAAGAAATAELRRQHREDAEAAAAALADAGGDAAALPELPPPPALAEIPDSHGDLALHLAARFDRADIVAALLADDGYDAAAALTARNSTKDTPLHVAARHGCARAAAALLEAAPAPAIGAALDAANKHSFTPAQLAERRGHAALAALLRRSGGGGASAAPAPAQQPPPAPGAAAKTLLVAPPECLEHYTCPQPATRAGPEPPPENTERLRVLVEPGRGSLRAAEFDGRVEWGGRVAPAPMGDLLRVHDWPYLKTLQAACMSIPDDPAAVGRLDADTAISRRTFAAARAAVAAVCDAVDRVVEGGARNAFCAVRPPGHHAGPRGVVPSANDPNGSHGFCLVNNVAAGAAYAMAVHRRAGVRRVAILDFDVHHGNGTEACVANTAPRTLRFQYETPLAEGVAIHHTWKPWLGEDDDENIFFASVQGYGVKAPGSGVYVYPGSGDTADTDELRRRRAAAKAAKEAARGGAGAGGEGGGEGAAVKAEEGGEAAAAAAAAAPPAAVAALSGDSGSVLVRVCPVLCLFSVIGIKTTCPQPIAQHQTLTTNYVNNKCHHQHTTYLHARPPTNAQSPQSIEEDPDHEFTSTSRAPPPLDGPRIIDVGIAGPGFHTVKWRRAWRDKVLPALVKFDPDIIFVSAGFDAHRKDEINFRYIGAVEADYEWLTDQIVQIANRCCAGRVVSVLEGGYNLRGGIVSAFARSVAAHVRALAEPHAQAYDAAEARAEREAERRRREERAAKAAERAAARAARLAAAAAGGDVAAAGEKHHHHHHHHHHHEQPPAQEQQHHRPGHVQPDEGGAAAAAAAAAAPEEDPHATEGSGRPKRRRTAAAVDYVALNAQLEEEAKAAAGGGGGK